MNDLPSTRTINYEPEMVAGLTGTEFLTIMFLSFISCCLATFVLWILTPYSAPKLFALCFLIALLSSFLLRKFLLRSKRNKPRDYYKQILAIQMDKIFKKNLFISYEGVWDNRRSGKRK